MNRIRLKIQNGIEQRFLIFYGFGVSDSFFTEEYQEIPMSSALLKVLKEQGYKRVIVINPQKPISFLDEESKILSNHIIWEKRQEVLRQGFVPDIQKGPFGNIRFFQENHNQNLTGITPLGDLHGLRLVDLALREVANYKTAIIIEQAEIFLSYFEDQRSMASIIGNWLRLPSYNSNLVCFIFSSANFVDLSEKIKSCPIPELSLLLNQKESHTSQNSPFILIEGPESDEIQWLLKANIDNRAIQIPENEIDTLVDWMVTENQSLGKWIIRLSQTNSLSIDLGKRNGWFTVFHQDSRSIEEKLNELVGLDTIKKRILELAGWINEKKKQGTVSSINLHMIFYGNPGTGKTTVARLLGGIFKEIGVLRKGHLIEVKGSDLVAEYVGGTAIKTNMVIDKALGGILFIDEAYSLSAKERGGFGQEALETLLIRMENDRNNFIVVMAGYTQQMMELLESNPGLNRRFPIENRFLFPDFTEEELLEISKRLFSSRDLLVSEEIEIYLKEIIHQMVSHKNENFGNAGEMRNLVESVERKCLSRYHFQNLDGDYKISKEDFGEEYLSYLNKHSKNENVDLILEELNQLQGITQAKIYFRQLFYRIQFENIQSIKKGNVRPNIKIPHLILIGNPGTGKTTTARIFGKFLYQLGLLQKGQFVEVTAADLIAGYVGQTPEKTMKVIKSSLGGVLFIDEAYSLVRGSNKDHYGQEVIDLLVKAMDKYEGQFCLVLAGYTDEMFDFLKSNPGLRSRFEDPIFFEDLSIGQFRDILNDMSRNDGIIIPENVMGLILEEISKRKNIQGKSFGNARELKKIYEGMKNRLAERIITSSGKRSDELGTLSFVPEDLDVMSCAINPPDKKSIQQGIFQSK